VYPGGYFTGSTDKALVYQLQGSASNGNRDIIVAINFGTTRLQGNQKINNRGGAIPQGTRFYDVFGTSAFPYQEVNNLQQVYIDLPAKSYTVWAQSSLILPVSLLSFNAFPSTNKVMLQWKVESEINIDRYDVERSENGINFNFQGKVTGINNGNNAYSYADENLPKSTVLYYRLKIFDKDGSFKYSDIIKVTFNKLSFDANIFPNPINGNTLLLTLELNKARKITVNIFNSLGQKVSSQQLNTLSGITNYPINVSTITAGSYTLIVDDGKEKIIKQFIKN
ncbi:MAG: T9SS type A sorting domain-containing protein, partial [Ferruginibacter sp.]|nr:T9SS type A sorting domain-containing protein [Ferruginibacter sp.]